MITGAGETADRDALSAAAEQLTRRVAEFVALIRRLPTEMLEERYWGPREMLSHIVFAHELYRSYVEAIEARWAPSLFTGRYRDQNARAVAEFKHVPVSQLLDELTASQEKIREFAEDPRATRIVWLFKVGARPRKFDEALLEIDAHIHGHLKEIKREQRRSARSSARA